MRIRHSGMKVLLIFAVVIAFSMVRATAPVHGQNRQTIGLELALLVDISASVNKEEYRLQLEGLAAAFRQPSVLEAIRDSGGIAICLILWAQKAYQYKSIEWTYLAGDADALKLSLQMLSIKRPPFSGQTAIGDALVFALRELQSNRYSGLRQVIDLSGDGRSNDGRIPHRAREEVLKNGITINGLAILNEVPDLKEYFQSRLIGGPGAFVMTARDYFDFSRAIREKLEREIGSTPVAGNTTDRTNTETHAGSTRSNSIEKMALGSEPFIAFQDSY